MYLTEFYKGIMPWSYNDTAENTTHHRNFCHAPLEQRMLDFYWFYLMDTGDLVTDCIHLFALDVKKPSKCYFVLQNQYETINNSMW